VILLWWTLFQSPAFAGSNGLMACCKAVGAGECPSTLMAFGPGSNLQGGPNGATVTGLWEVSCNDGPFFDPIATRQAPLGSRDGQVLSVMPTGAAACFNAACQLPPQLCLRHEGDVARFVACKGGPAGEILWTQSASPSTAVVVANRVLRVERVATAAAQARPPAPAPAPGVVPQPGAAPRPAPASSGPVDFTVPPEPPTPCIPNSAMRDASNQQVDEGNEATLRGDVALAISKYRAAITIMDCNAFGWAALGETLLTAQQPARAQTALVVATRIMPAHYQAWTNLGKAYEGVGATDKAIDAFEHATRIKPGYLPAEQGLVRVRPR
jgi:hypothetical protein